MVSLAAVILCAALSSALEAATGTETASGAEAVSGAAGASELTLDEALSLVMKNHPGLESFRLGIEAAGGRLLQAHGRPNPHLTFEAENFGGRGDLGGTGSAEYTVRLEQDFELGGKRSKRIGLAAEDRRIAEFDLAAGRLDITGEATRRFIETLAAQERTALEGELTALAESFFAAVSARVRSGKVSPLEETRAEVILTKQRITYERSRRAFDAARMRLAALWGEPAPDFERVAGDLESIPSLPPLERLGARLRENPDLARWSAEISRREAALAMEKASRVPDVTAGAGARSLNETGDRAFVAELSIPFPLLDRNRGGIRAAEAEIARAYEERRAAELRARIALSESHQVLAAALAEASTLKSEILPRAEEVLEKVTAGYAQGKFGLLDVLDAQKTFFDAKAGYLEALADCHRALVDVERLAGGPEPNTTMQEH